MAGGVLDFADELFNDVFKEQHAGGVELAPEMERHQVPVEYLANPELAQALQTVHTVKTPTAVEAADAIVKERMFLIGKEGGWAPVSSPAAPGPSWWTGFI